MTIWLILILAIAIISGLALYAVKLLLQLKKQQHAEKNQIKERNQNLAESIDTIGMAMEQGQCDYSEGVLRICVLLDHLKPNSPIDFTQVYPQMYNFYDKIKDIATHEKRTNLSINERMRQDAERLKYEAENKSAIEQEELPKLRKFISEYL